MGPEIALIATLASTGMSVIGGMQTAAAQEDASKYQAQVAKNNQIISEQNASYAAVAAATKTQAEDMKNRALFGSIEAAQGASGIAFDSPTMEQIRQSQEQVGRLSSRTVYNDGLLTARGFQQQAGQFGAEAQLADMRASSAASAGTTAAFSSLISGASSFSDKWMRYRNVGISGY